MSCPVRTPLPTTEGDTREFGAQLVQLDGVRLARGSDFGQDGRPRRDDVTGLPENPRFSGGTVRALDETSLTVPQGTILGIVGESGSGKTTAALAIARLLDASGGEVNLYNIDLFQLENIKTHVGIHFRCHKFKKKG